MHCEVKDHLHPVRTVLDEIDAGTGVTLVNLDQSKDFDRVDYRFLKATLEAAGFGECYLHMNWILIPSPQCPSTS